jgi:chromosomal replication initiator protein
MTRGEDMFELWDRALNSIHRNVKSQNFDIWLRPIQCHSIEDGHVTLQVPNRFFKDYITGNYLDLIQDQIEHDTGRRYHIDFVVSEDPQAPEERPSRPPQPMYDTLGSNGRKRTGILIGTLNERNTFDGFVVGPSNQLAHAGSMAVASMVGRKYNPLFIYGGVGLGKTHLVHAIGHEIRSKRPELNIFYISSEQFMNDFISSVRNQRQHEFQQKYRHDCDVLLMDDIQFIAGKDRTQDEFFHTFNSLYDQQKQIVLTCDKYPQEIDNIEERLRSRFQWGLIADIQSPEFETRVAIIKKKAEAEHIELPNDIAFLIAENVRANVRELECALTRLLAEASMYRQPLDVDLAKRVLQNTFNVSTPKATIDDIQREVARYYNIRIGDLKGKSRQQSVTLPRMVAMYLSRLCLSSSFPEIGERFGDRDHTTVMNAFRKIERAATTDLAVRSAVDTIRRKLSI